MKDAWEYTYETLTTAGVPIDAAQAMDVASAMHGKVVVHRSTIDLFAAALTVAVEAGAADRSLWDQFAESFPEAASSRFLGH